jgi:acetyl esterase/lipase
MGQKSTRGKSPPRGIDRFARTLRKGKAHAARIVEAMFAKNALVLGASLIGAAAALAGASHEKFRVLSSVWFSRIVAEDVPMSAGRPYGPLARQKLDIYWPLAGREPRAIVIFLYGGGWREGEREWYRFAGAALAAQGFVAVVPDYRLYPGVQFPVFMQDAALAYGWTQKHLNAGGGKTPIVLMGHSAGAHMAALLALDPALLAGQPRPAAVIGLAGPYAFDPTTWPSTRDVFRTAAAHPDAARPIAFVSATAPPMFFARGAEDDVVAAFNADDMTRALGEQGVLAENRLYPGLGHAGLVLALARPFRWRAPVLTDSVAFIDKVLAKAPH